MTSVSAVMAAPAADVQAPTQAPSGPVQGGPSFEVALNKVLAGPTVQSQPQPPAAPTQLADAPQVQAPKAGDDAPVELPSEAIAAFLAVFFAMAGQALTQQTQPGSTQSGGAQAVD